MRRLLVAFLALAVAGCDPVEEGSNYYVPTELRELSDNAMRCQHDVYEVPLEHSEHCVSVAETYLDSGREDCEESRSFECRAYNEVLYDIRSMYGDAIITSIVEHKLSAELQEAADAAGTPYVFFDGPLLRRLFNRCLAEERGALAAEGLVPVTEVILPTLRPGQRCFRKGYPPFATRKVA